MGTSLAHAFETAEGHWMLLRYTDNLPIRLDARILDRIVAADEALYLVVEPLTCALPILSGLTAAARIAEALAPYTRSARITRKEGYEDAKRRLELASRNMSDNAASALYVGDLQIQLKGEHFYIGGEPTCSLEQVRRMSKAEESIVVWHPVRAAELQACLLLLLAAASWRPQESVDELSRRIADYEQEFSP